MFDSAKVVLLSIKFNVNEWQNVGENRLPSKCNIVNFEASVNLSEMFNSFSCHLFLFLLFPSETKSCVQTVLLHQRVLVTLGTFDFYLYVPLLGYTLT